MRRAAAALFLAIALSTAPSSAQEPPEGSLGIRLVDAPEERRDDPRAQSYIVDHLNPGDTITRHVELSSTGSEPLDVQLYVAAATLEDGDFKFGEGRAENDLTDWSTIDPPALTLPPSEKLQAAVTIDIPADASDGERYGVIWAELPGTGGSANVVNRVGVRIYLSVGDGDEPVSDFSIETLTAKRDENGIPIVETSVTNTGGRAIDLSGSLQLDNGPGSLSAGPFDVQIGTTLAPGDTAPARVVLDPELPAGPWDATVTITAGRLQKEATGTITFPDEPGEAAEPVDANSASGQRKVLVPVAIVGAAVAGGLSAVMLLRGRALKAAGVIKR